MKNQFKIFLLLSVIFFTNSCSNDDSVSTVPVSSNKTIKKYSEKIYSNGQIQSQFSRDFNYENGKLISISDNLNKMEFIYNLDQIIEVKIYNNNQLSSTNSLTYNGSLLTSIVNNLNNEKTVLNYNNGVLSSLKNQDYNGTGWIDTKIKIYTFQNSNVQKLITEDTGSSAYKSTFEYDTNNSPMKNMNPYLKYLLEYESCDFISINNVLKRFSHPNTTTSTGILSTQYTTDYNSDNFPVLIKKYSVIFGQERLVSEATIEYNN